MRNLWLAVQVLAALAAAFVLGMLAEQHKALAHDHEGITDWIGNSGQVNPVTKLGCCGPNDCHRMPPEAAFYDRKRDAWFIKETGEWYPDNQTIPSKDRYFYRCQMPSDPATRCLFVPKGGV